MAKNYRSIAYQLHEGKQVCLSKLILGCLYECLNDGATDMSDQVESLIIHGFIWLFQLWLLATFKSKLTDTFFLLEDFEETYDKRSTEGFGLELFRYKETKTSQKLFLEAFKFFLDCDIFTPYLSPFSTRTCGLD